MLSSRKQRRYSFRVSMVANEHSPIAPQARAMFSARTGWLVAGLVLAIFLAYQPVWTAGFIWDDDGHLTKPGLRTVDGLLAIWLVPGASQQYYPLLHSVFWGMNRLFGQEPAAYHGLNIALHAGVVVLLFAVLRRLRVRAAFFAAAIFALHPVMVESVAWISEMKNTLSAFFYFAAAWVYLRYDAERRPGDYLGAFLLYFCALLSKTTAASLPAALLVVFWWKRGRVSWRDVAPLLPFFAAGMITGLFTAWVERYDIGATGADFNYTFIERGLIAGRALWFYAGKLVWPADLIFVYPRWQISAANPALFAWPLAAMAVLAGLIWLSRWRRGPLAGGLFFAGTLFPALGFFNIYPFRFSFVADHFQYLASLGLIVPLACALQEFFAGRRARLAAGGVLLGGLAVLTFRQARDYDDNVALYANTIAKNPRAALAYVNLGSLYADAGQWSEALVNFEHALALTPDDASVWQNVAVTQAALGKLPEARVAALRALALDPAHRQALFSMGSIAYAQGNSREAAGYFRQAVAVAPRDGRARAALGTALSGLGYLDAALEQFRIAHRLLPRDPQVQVQLEEAEARAKQIRDRR